MRSRSSRKVAHPPAPTTPPIYAGKLIETVPSINAAACEALARGGLTSDPHG